MTHILRTIIVRKQGLCMIRWQMTESLATPVSHYGEESRPPTQTILEEGAVWNACADEMRRPWC